MQLEVLLATAVLSLSYGKYGVPVTNGWISSLWKVICQEGVQLYTRTPTILPDQRKKYRLLMEIITNTVKFTSNELSCVNSY